MSQNRRTVERYMEGFRKTDHAQILACLTDDVVWDGTTVNLAMCDVFEMRGGMIERLISYLMPTP